MDRRTPSEFRDSIRKVRRLYSTPQVLSKAMRLVHQPEVDLAMLGELIRSDGALVADLVRLSSSAMYSRGEAPADLNGALQRLGVREVIRAIDLSLSKNVFGKGLGNYGIDATQYWRTSLLAGLMMEQLAFIHGVDAPEAYTVGMLHALGRVLINEVLEEVGTGATWDRGQALELWEVNQVGFTHAEAGALLLREWAFPEPVIAPIEHQLGTPAAVPAQTSLGMMRFVRLLLTWDPEATTTPQPAALPRDLLGWAGFATQNEALEILTEAQEQVAGTAGSLDMSGG